MLKVIKHRLDFVNSYTVREQFDRVIELISLNKKTENFSCPQTGAKLKISRRGAKLLIEAQGDKQVLGNFASIHGVN